ncbi:hypothetical protein B0H63DRAFT_473776 [Podospora didyma]|uniref:Uncharacterized protein n=1 Tax=Podospora didyma TaxID=330526 RepID=A0AAE0U017_9PEZI|nr:hypothetical protein B0H63DRAFT_473776 [Podospora didyma]
MGDKRPVGYESRAPPPAEHIRAVRPEYTYTHHAEQYIARDREIPREHEIRLERERDFRERQVAAERAAILETVRARELMVEVQTLDRDLKWILDPILEDERVRRRVAERLEAIRQDARLKAVTALGLLRALGSLPDDEPSGPLPPPPNAGGSRPRSGEQFLSANMFTGGKGGSSGRRRSGTASGNVSEGDETDMSDLSWTSHERRSGGQSLGPSQGPNFMEWSEFKECILPARGNFVERSHEALLATYEGINVSVEAFGFGIGLEGFLVKVRDWCHRKDLLALWKSCVRKILVPSPRAGLVDDGRGGLELLERQIFDIDKFNDSHGRHLTALTYGEGHYGTITLFEVDMFPPPNHDLPRQLKPVASMELVPKAIIKKMQAKVDSSRKTTLQMRKDGLHWGPRGARRPASKEAHRPDGTRSRGVSKDLRYALAQIPEPDNSDAVAATLPQMLAWLHLRSGVLETLVTSPANVKGRRLQIEWHDGPKWGGHESSKTKITVLSPAESSWAQERVIWR